MKRYRTPAPRTAFALAALLATTATLALAVLPGAAPAESAARVAPSAATEVAIVPSRIDVIAVRAQAAAHNDTTRDARPPARRG